MKKSNVKMQVLHNDHEINVAFQHGEGLYFLQGHFTDIKHGETYTRFTVKGTKAPLSFDNKTLEEGIFLNQAVSKDWWNLLVKDFGFKRT
jgi:hypothetical protein